MKPDHKCIRCAIYKQSNGKCPIFTRDVSQERGCPMFAAELDPCDICGKHIPDGKVFLINNNTLHQVCPQCNELIRTQQCQVCAGSIYCAFQQDQSCQIQPYIVVQRRQGNAVVQMQQKNPERIAATCAKGCKCYFNEMCLREEGDCPNQQIAWEHFKK